MCTNVMRLVIRGYAFALLCAPLRNSAADPFAMLCCLSCVGGGLSLAGYTLVGAATPRICTTARTSGAGF